MQFSLVAVDLHARFHVPTGYVIQTVHSKFPHTIAPDMASRFVVFQTISLAHTSSAYLVSFASARLCCRTCSAASSATSCSCCTHRRSPSRRRRRYVVTTLIDHAIVFVFVSMFLLCRLLAQCDSTTRTQKRKCLCLRNRTSFDSRFTSIRSVPFADRFPFSCSLPFSRFARFAIERPSQQDALRTNVVVNAQRNRIACAAALDLATSLVRLSVFVVVSVRLFVRLWKRNDGMYGRLLRTIWWLRAKRSTAPFSRSLRHRLLVKKNPNQNHECKD
jgi:hypothetical protein